MAAVHGFTGGRALIVNSKKIKKKKVLGKERYRRKRARAGGKGQKPRKKNILATPP